MPLALLHHVLRRSFAALLAVVVASAVLVVADPVAAVDDAHVTGRVSGPGGAPLAGVSVTAYRYDDDGDWWQPIQWATTDAAGDYDLEGLPAGTVRLGFQPPSGNHVQEYWNDAPTVATATDVVVAAGTTVSGRNAQLAAAAHVTGTVTGTGGTALDGVDVTAYRYDAQDEYWAYVASTSTGTTGTYDLGGLAGGTYRIGFSDYSGDHLPEYWNDQSTVETAADVVVAAGVTAAGRNAELATAGHITGTVTGPGGAALDDVAVTAYRYDPADRYWRSVSWADAQTDGTYDLRSLPSGTYRIGFDPYDDAHLAEYWNDAASVETATDVVVVPGATVSGRDAQLATASHVTGTVTGPAGTPLEQVEVTLYRWEDDYWSWVRSDTTNAEGTYDVGGLSAGTYRVGFRDRAGNHLPEYWNDQATVEAATDVVVGSAATVAGRDAQLATASHITGTVTGPGGTGVDDVEVQAYRYDDARQSWREVAYVYTSSTGDYDLGGLAAGTYRLGFDPESGTVLDEYWNDKQTIASADDIVVGAATTVAGRDAQLAAASHVTGTVTGVGGSPLADVRATAYRYDTDEEYWDSVASDWTDATGGYDVGGLASGTYRIGFSTSGSGAYIDEYWDDQPTLSTATDVVVGVASTVAGRNAQLATAAHLTGTVTGSAGAALEDVDVYAYRYDPQQLYWQSVAHASTDASGAYDVGGLAAGTYRLGFHPTGGYLGEYWNDKATLNAADDIAVGAGATVGGRNAQLATASHITGTVTGPAGAPLADVNVRVYFLQDGYWDWDRSATTTASGTYDVGGLAAGTYRLGFRDGSGTHAPEFWDDKTTVETAADIVVGASTTVAGRNAQLAVASHVAGRVTGDGGVPLANVDVTAYRYDANDEYWAGVGYATTDATGAYDVGGLAAGTYRVGVDPTGDYAGEFYNDKASVETADDVVVAASATTGGRDVQLAPAGHVTGTVTGPDGAPLDEVEITAYRFDTSSSTWRQVGYDETDETGTYDVGGLGAGTYRIGFYDYGTTAYAREFWNDQPDVQSAQDIVVSAGGTVTGRDAQLGAGASIAGRLTDAAGHGVEADVVAYRRNAAGTYVETAWGYSTGAGDYSVKRLPAGTYRLEFQPYDGHAGEFYDDASTLASATDVVVAAGGAVTGRNATLAASTTPPITSTAPPTITGTPQVGQTLTASAGTWSPAPDAVRYQWLAAGAAIPGATGATYAPAPSDVGKALSVRVTATKAGHTDAAAESAATAAVAAAPAPPAPPATPQVRLAKAPVITGTAVVGQKLKVSAGSWTPASVTVTYQWLANGKTIKGATKSSLKLGKSLQGARLTVTVTASAGGYSPATATTKATKKVKPKPKKRKRVVAPRVQPAVLL